MSCVEYVERGEMSGRRAGNVGLVVVGGEAMLLTPVNVWGGLKECHEV